jgi:hypothetical protein
VILLVEEWILLIQKTYIKYCDLILGCPRLFPG